MKLTKLFALAAVAGIFAASTASATVTIRLSGSTAFRAATVSAIKASMSGGSPQYAWQSSSSFTGASFHIFRGTVSGIGDPDVIVKCSWSGSVSGVKAVTTSQLLTFLADSTPMSTTPTTAANGANVNASNLVSNEGAPVICMSDTYQGSTKYQAITLTDDTIVGVVPFIWVASNGAPASLTNITPLAARSLLTNGAMSPSIATGNVADASDTAGTGFWLYMAGRDPLSGTRVTAFAESGFGTKSEANQFRPKATGVSGTFVCSEIEQTPADPANDAVHAGDGGETSGGTLADKMRYDYSSVAENSLLGLSGTKVVMVTYMGTSDAARATTGTGSSVTGGSSGNAKQLTWNGVPYSTANVQEGYYTFWGYEHIMVKPGQPNAAALRARMVTNFPAFLSLSGGIDESTMRVQRFDDGGVITQKY